MKPLVMLALAALAAPMSTPAGRPPTGPLVRENPRLYDVRFGVALSTQIPYALDDPRVRRPNDPAYTPPQIIDWGGWFEVADVPIVMPLIFQSTWSAVDMASVRGELFLGDRPDPTLAERFRIDDGLPHHTHLAVLPIVSFRGKNLRWSVDFRTEVFDSRIDDAAAATLRWPREWPKDVQDGLRPQMYIESDDPLFQETVDRVSAGQLRLVPPYLAAKDLVRHGITAIHLEGDGEHRGRVGVLHGLEIKGALQTARDGRGGPHDIVCVCVALLCAAGIPVRLVIGIWKRERAHKTRHEFVSWGEFYLEAAGWIPFDPNEIRRRGAHHRDVHMPWPDFGTMDELNKRVPLAYHFLPPARSSRRCTRHSGDGILAPPVVPSAEQRITLSITGRGRPPTPLEPAKPE